MMAARCLSTGMSLFDGMSLAESIVPPQQTQHMEPGPEMVSAPHVIRGMGGVSTAGPDMPAAPLGVGRYIPSPAASISTLRFTVLPSIKGA